MGILSGKLFHTLRAVTLLSWQTAENVTDGFLGADWNRTSATFGAGCRPAKGSLILLHRHGSATESGEK